MRAVAQECRSWIPETEADKEVVLQQMNRLLQTTHFRNSRRYPALFRFIVEETLEGRGEHLKERVLGVTVFSKSPDYDTAADPTVRVSVAEIRKRIAQYYHEDAHEHELRIDILPGRYQPEFRLSRLSSNLDGDGEEHQEESSETQIGLRLEDERDAGLEASWGPGLATLAHEQQASAPMERSQPSVAMGGGRKKLFHSVFVYAFALLFVSGVAGLLWRSWHRTAILELWTPIYDAKGQVLIAIAGGPEAHDFREMRALLDESSDAPPAPPTPQVVATTEATGTPSTFLNHMVLEQNIVFADALGMTKVLQLLATNKRDYTIRLSGDTTLNDLRRGPSVLIGGLDNAWTLREIGRLRYRFDADNNYHCWIYDSRNPQNSRWSLDLKKRYESVNRDYAIIARVHNEQTGMPQIVIAGLGMSGTVAASEFFVDPDLSKRLQEKIGRRFADQDFEAVIGTDVVNGVAGPPTVLAVEVW